MEKPYDSTEDTMKHKNNIVKVATPILQEFEDRITHHDDSKLQTPEKPCYDKYIPMLKTAKYGTKEYYEIRAHMATEGLDHHYKVNRHHPEHFRNGCKDMNLVDLIEMLCDWKAASLLSDTSFEKGFESNCQRFHISGDVKDLLWRTYKEYLDKQRLYGNYIN